MLGNIVQVPGVGIDIVEQDVRVGILKQEFDRRIGHEVAGSYENEDVRADTASVSYPVFSTDLECGLLTEHRLVFLSDCVQQDRHIQESRCIREIGGNAPEQLVPQEGNIPSFKDCSHDGRLAHDEVRVFKCLDLYCRAFQALKPSVTRWLRPVQPPLRCLVLRRHLWLPGLARALWCPFHRARIIRALADHWPEWQRAKPTFARRTTALCEQRSIEGQFRDRRWRRAPVEA